MKTAREAAARIGRVGVWHHDLERLGAAAARDTVSEIESQGYGAIWIPESLGSKEIMAHSAILLGGGSRIVIAPGIANIWARDPVAMANGAKTLVEAYPDRFLLGLGVSHAPVIALRGDRYRKPLERMRAYLDAMDAAPYVGPNKGDPPAPRVLAALGPAMLRLAGERSLGAHPYFVPIEHTVTARAALGPDPLLAVELAVVLETDADKARALGRRHTKYYLKLDNYANNLRRLGWADADLANGGSDRLVDAVVAWGDAARIGERIAAHHAAGADHVCIQVFGDDASADLRSLAQTVLR